MGKARVAALRRLGAADLDGLLASGAHGVPATEAPVPPEAGAAKASAEGRPGGPRPVTDLVLFDRGSPDDARLARVLADAAAAHGADLRAAAMPASAAAPRLRKWQEGRRPFDTFDFDRWPAVGVFRGGRLVTTFHPRRVFSGEGLQAREEREQVEIFLSKMVYYDPAKVKEQKSLELEAEA